MPSIHNLREAAEKTDAMMEDMLADVALVREQMRKYIAHSRMVLDDPASTEQHREHEQRRLARAYFTLEKSDEVLERIGDCREWAANWDRGIDTSKA